jgi:hypothetical protein
LQFLTVKCRIKRGGNFENTLFNKNLLKQQPKNQIKHNKPNLIKKHKKKNKHGAKHFEKSKENGVEQR